MRAKLAAEFLGPFWLVPGTQHGPALFVGGWAVQQLWLFWVAPIADALLAGVAFHALFEPEVEEPPVTGR